MQVDSALDRILSMALYVLWQLVYFVSALPAMSRTQGKVIFGLKVVNVENGTPVRTIFLPISIAILFGVLIGVCRGDRQELHDILARTGVVYSWDARMACYRQEQVDRSVRLYARQHADEDGIMNDPTAPPQTNQRLRKRTKTRKEMASDVKRSARATWRTRSSLSIQL